VHHATLCTRLRSLLLQRALKADKTRQNPTLFQKKGFVPKERMMVQGGYSHSLNAGCSICRLKTSSPPPGRGEGFLSTHGYFLAIFSFMRLNSSNFPPALAHRSISLRSIIFSLETKAACIKHCWSPQ